MSIGTVASTTTASGSSAAGTSNALLQLGSNFNDFMSMLLTQLQNQDPTDPMDTQSFTTELVQFTGVEQQVATNDSLTQLIQLTQANQVEQSAQIVGQQVAVQSSALTLQNASAALQYTASAAGPVTVTVSNGSGSTLFSQTVSASAGQNSWAWNGEATNGAQLPDGTYNVAITSGSGNSAVPFVVDGTVTGIQNSSGTVSLELGSLTVPMTALSAMIE